MARTLLTRVRAAAQAIHSLGLETQEKAKADAELRSMYCKDAVAYYTLETHLEQIATAIEKATDIATNLDTAARDELPRVAFPFIGLQTLR